MPVTATGMENMRVPWTVSPVPKETTARPTQSGLFITLMDYAFFQLAIPGKWGLVRTPKNEPMFCQATVFKVNRNR